VPLVLEAPGESVHDGAQLHAEGARGKVLLNHTCSAACTAPNISGYAVCDTWISVNDVSAAC
jgi:hypothetical protein